MRFWIDFITSFTWFTILEMIIILMNLVALIGYAVPKSQPHRWLDFLPSVALIAAIVSILTGNITLVSIVFYGLTLILFLCTMRRLFKRNPAAPRFHVGKSVLCVCGVIAMLSTFIYAGEFRYNPASELSDLSYSQAFVQLNERLSKEYPFGEWKKVNWQELKEKYEPLFKKWEEEKNKNAYYKTLREYLYSFRDGHIKIVNENLYEDNPLFKSEVGGGFGISTIQLDNGKVLVNLVLQGSSAEKNGIKVGAEIITWNGSKAQDVYRRTTWSENPMATDGDARFNQGRFMVRAPIGTEISVTFTNMDETQIRTATLKAEDDNYETLKKTRLKLKKEDDPIEAKIIEDGYGYVKVRYFLPSETMPNPGKVFEEKVKGFNDQHIKGLIIDLRDNPGGSDDLVAELAGFLVPKEMIYEKVSYYNRLLGTFEINSLETRTITPVVPLFEGKIVIVFNHRTTSSGEGMPILLKGLPNVKNVGFTTTNGSFGVVSSPIEVEMPEGYMVRFPDGRSLSGDLVIQGDSDHAGHGGAIPDVFIPLNEETFTEKYVHGRDVELEYALKVLKDFSH
ncbi:S41 family peptidase [Brevibacillus reuszeri]|uniref:S41 family peptidase n=1 Tax=Brevibacillus reuszeri TaxID=54915 RepID=UPI0028A2A21E|nr:S41 family peptidase [Brevibacillus reuszeri]